MPSHHLVSTSFTLLGGAALIAGIGVMVMAWHVPELFRQMPPALVPEVRLGVIAVGLSTAFALPFNSFSAIFTGPAAVMPSRPSWRSPYAPSLRQR